MIRVDVILKDDRIPNSQIRMKMEDYKDFIEKQSELLGIKEAAKPNRTLFTNVDMKNVNSLDEAIKEINKAMRRNPGC